jgi:hypothetical protein
VSKKSLWRVYLHGEGYLAKYHNFVLRCDAEELGRLHKGLDDIFSTLQCLPVSAIEKGKSIIWKACGGKINFVANPIYYRLQEIGGNLKSINNGPQRPQVSVKTLEKRLNCGATALNKRVRKVEKSQRKRNYRAPPRRKNRNPLVLPIAVVGESLVEAAPEGKRTRSGTNRKQEEQRIEDKSTEESESTEESGGAETADPGFTSLEYDNQ